MRIPLKSALLTTLVLVSLVSTSVALAAPPAPPPA
jgi:hypothetical protein